MAILYICIASFLASLLTFFSGFGLGTLLMPVVAIFLPVPVAVALTAVVHFMSKIFKVILLWRAIDRGVLLTFGAPAVLAAIPGALLLTHLAVLPSLASYVLAGHACQVTPVGLAVGVLLIFFATAEWMPFLRNRTLRGLGLPLGGLLSGFFGGLSGHQGAFRSAFLVQGGLSEKEFVATNAAIAALVDGARLVVYGLTFSAAVQTQWSLVMAAVIASFLGIFLGAQLLAKVTMRFIQRLIAGMMCLLGLLLVAGII